MRRLVALLVLSTLFLVPAGQVCADDWVEIDDRLADEGFQDPWTDVLDAGDGVRVSVDFVSDSADAAAFAAEGEAIAEVVWNHLELPVQAVDVITTAPVSWLEEGLPAAVSLSRADLQERFGPRSSALDEGSTPMDDEAFLAALAGGVGLVVLAVGAGGGFLLGFLLGRRRRAPAQQAGWGTSPWDAPTAAPPGWLPQQQAWGRQQGQQQAWGQQQPWAQPQPGPPQPPNGASGYTPTAPNPPST